VLFVVVMKLRQWEIGCGCGVVWWVVMTEKCVSLFVLN
jgi:hypothetical protein